MIEPTEGGTPTAATEVRVMADARDLYIGIWAADDDPAGISILHTQDILPFFTRRLGLYEGEQVPIQAGGKVSGRVGRTNFG